MTFHVFATFIFKTMGVQINASIYQKDNPAIDNTENCVTKS